MSKELSSIKVKKFAKYSFSSRNEALDPYGLYQLDYVEAHLLEEEVIIDKDIEEEEKACTEGKYESLEQEFQLWR